MIRLFVKAGMTRCLLLFSLGSAMAMAHDPGLSSATVDLSSREILVQLVFAPADLGTGATRQNQAAASAELRAGTEALRASSVEARELGKDNVEFTLRFPRPATETNLRSALLTSLPFGHRQAVTVRDEAGAVLVTDLLSATHDAVILPAPAASGSFPFRAPSAGGRAAGAWAAAALFVAGVAAWILHRRRGTIR